MSQKLQELIFNEKYYKMVPRPTPDEWHALDQSIARNGLHEPIVINEKGVILDGYTRYEICQNRGISVMTTTKSFETPEQELRYVLEVNATRRQLNAFQRVELWYPIFEIYREDSKHNNNWRLPSKGPLGGSLIRFSQLIGVGQKRTHAAIKIIESDDEELKRQCRNGTITVNAAYTSMKEAVVPGGCKVDGKNTYPSMNNILKFFKGSPVHAQLESILQMYREANP